MTRRLDAALGIAALLLIAFGIYRIEATTAGLEIRRTDVGTTPVTLLRLRDAPPAPVVVIAHGFAGSQQLMQPFAVTLARNGYVALTFDALGHGRNPEPLHGSLVEPGGATRALVDQLDGVVAFARTLPGGDGRVALLGHSMASDIVVREANAQPSIDATIAVSMFAPDVTPASPRNLLVIAGALEPDLIKDQGRKTTAMVADGPPREHTTYGDVAAGTGRRFSFSPGVEHIGVLYSPASLREALDWLDLVYHRRSAGYIGARGTALASLFLGLILLARPLSTLLPPVAGRPLGAGLCWRELLPVAIMPALLTPLILWRVPTGFLPLVLGDYLAAHLLVYGVLTAIGLRLVRRATREAPAAVSIPRLVLGAAFCAFYGVIVFGLPIDRYVASFMPIPVRLPIIAALLLGTLPYFLADEWLTRGATAPRAAYAFTKVCFVASLAIAVALNLEKLFFLVVIAIVVVAFFVIYGLFSGLAYRQTRHPFVGGLANALAFAWAIAVTFPLLRG